MRVHREVARPTRNESRRWANAVGLRYRARSKIVYERVRMVGKEWGMRSIIEMLPFLDQALYIVHQASVKVKDF